MTHTLHRIESRTDLRGDLVFLCTPAKGINAGGAAPKLRRLLAILRDAGPLSMGFYGCNADPSYEEMDRRINDHSRLRCLFDDPGKVVDVLRRVKSENLGLSVAVTGSLPEVLSIAGEAELTPHTANIPLGIFGKTERLPPEEVLEVATMCGHGMMSFRLVEETFAQVRQGALSIEAAVEKLQRPCTCGLVNPARTRAILEKEALIRK
jgi:hypothetical protein